MSPAVVSGSLDVVGIVGANLADLLTEPRTKGSQVWVEWQVLSKNGQIGNWFETLGVMR